MNIADISIKRPVFISAVVVILLTMGFMAFRRMPVDMFPNVTFPIVAVTTMYPGAGPEEVETLVSRVLEDEISNLAGIKSVRSTNMESVSTVIAEFTLETDIRYAEQQIRDKVSSAQRKLPDDIEVPVIRRMDPADQPILILSLTADLPEAALFDLADLRVRPLLEQVKQVGLVEVVGGRKREVHVELDRRKLKNYEVSATTVAARIGTAGQNVPAGTVDEAKTETSFRTLGEFPSIKDIGSVVVSFLGNDVPITVSQVGRVVDTVADEQSRAFVNGKKSVFLLVYRQSGANTIAVADAVKTRLDTVNKSLGEAEGKGNIIVVRDGAQAIRDNVYDVQEAIIIGILLTIVVVYFFLGSGRSTFITGLALPTSLIGAFFLMGLAGFSVNIMTLLALSLAVGLLIDDAIVVRENIFRHMEMGKSARQAASEGTNEVLMAVVAVTLAVIAVFAPIAFLSGVVGQFFKEFGLTICFAMAISLFDAVTMAPMLSAYFAGKHAGHGNIEKVGLWGRTMGRALKAFDRFQTSLENLYERILRVTLRYPLLVLGGALGIFVLSLFTVKYIPKTFIPASDTGEFSISIDLPAGTSLDATTETANQIDAVIRANPEVLRTVMFVGGFTGQANAGTFFVRLVPSKERSTDTTGVKEKVRGQLKAFAHARPLVKDVDVMGGGQRPFSVNLIGADLPKLEEISVKLIERLKKHPGLVDVDTSHRTGKPEFQVVPDKQKAERLGAATNVVGQEIRAQIEGVTPAKYREKGEEYDIRVRLQADQRNLREGFDATWVPNVNQTLIRLKDVANPVETVGPATITRQDRGRYIQIGADIAPDGPGMAAVMDDVKTILEEEIKLPPDVRYAYVGQAESFQELISSVIVAAALGILFIYLVLASLYESYVTPFTILLVLPLAMCGAFFALLITGESLNIFSMIGCVMLMGIATKNSILLVDYTKQLMESGKDMADSIVEAGRVRLRPIMMTTLALIAGMLPIAIGLNEASKQRTAMGVAVVGGLVSSTLLTLLVVPAAYSYLERYRRWSLSRVRGAVGLDEENS